MKVERFIGDFMEDDRAFSQTMRVCTECGRIMQSGFLAGDEYYCCEEHLYKHISKMEWLLAYMDIGMDVAMKLIPDWDELTEEEQIKELERLSEDWYETSDECYYTEWEDGKLCTRFSAEAHDTDFDFRNEEAELDKPINGIWFVEPHEMTVMIDNWINDKKSLPMGIQVVCNESNSTTSRFVWLDNSTGDCWVNEYEDMESLLKDYYGDEE